MSTTSELIRRMLVAHKRGDNSSFDATVRELVIEERRKNHHIFAKDIEKILENGSRSSTLSVESLLPLGLQSSDLPKDKERGLYLVEISEPKRSLEDLVLTRRVRHGIEKIIVENQKTELLESHGIRPSRKVLFCGPPGCGKTVAAEVVARALYLPLVLVRFDAVVSSYLGETAANLRKVFDFARSRSMLMLFDEFDAIGKSRSNEEEHGELKRVVNSFLQMLDSFKGEALTIAATNHEGLLDHALWRRFDEIVYFDRPDVDSIQRLLVQMFRQIGLSASISIADVSSRLIGMSHADVERMAIDTIKRSILENRPNIEPSILEESINEQVTRMSLSEGSGRSNPKIKAKGKQGIWYAAQPPQKAE